MPLKRVGAAAALAFLLSGCGLVSLPESRPADIYFVSTLAPGELTPGMVAYMAENQFGARTMPGLPYRGMTIDGDAIYRGVSPRLRLQVFVSSRRPDCPLVPSGREGVRPALLCDGPGGGVVLAEAVLQPNVSTAFHLQGEELDRAARNKTLYLGVRVLEGQLTPDEWVEVKNIVVRGRV
ncbi:hypothetical protein E5F05_11120 [Deinococcus metallilatus]|uniref:Lipoprotein n=1 Tax=Deinococcus metallilatus TaxID=1211322 RepID=A0AAJ5F1N8_9DEIO|nr:hypothetical protein [Deinococcus metallilatus]MBB5296531.1 hypothetical protein [Deinococcus metallilatus]QBY08441.1 hypothetical protein E5F05_11120 [Deinococcus metallilatus]RXJ11240.1 hypothetical protein ERJ73_09940 [Deinococcus metallilatus]TLK24731.1 hypothetical protein FCS05_14375 [Deinococcus metallilatus]GMA17449.1 hypothetical protein GCM10025871_37800 [Deinococcus metallilatus]